jgi:hypothetical protein
MDGYYLNKVVKRDFFVRMAPKCLHRVEDHLTFRTDSSVPFVFILNDERTGSNVVGLNLEDMNLYRFNFPDKMMNATCVPCSGVSGEVLSFEESKRRIYLYDINSGICRKKCIVSRGNYPSDISHILESNRGLFIISKGLCSNDDGSARYPGMKKQTLGSVLYQSVNDNGKVIEIEPLMSLAFLVSCACYSQSFIVMSTATHSKRSNLYCFNLETNKMTVINIPFDEEGYRFFERTVVKCLLPVHDKILVLTRLTSMLVSIDQETETYNTEISNFAPSEKGNPRYMFVSDLLVELNAKTVRLYRKSKERSFFEMLRSFELNRLNSFFKPVTCAYVKRTIPVCQMLCPHCDPNAKKKEEEDKRRQEEEERQKNRTVVWNRNDCAYFFDFSDSSDDYNYSDDYHYDSVPHGEMRIWDASADEFVIVLV